MCSGILHVEQGRIVQVRPGATGSPWRRFGSSAAVRSLGPAVGQCRTHVQVRPADAHRFALPTMPLWFGHNTDGQEDARQVPYTPVNPQNPKATLPKNPDYTLGEKAGNCCSTHEAS